MALRHDQPNPRNRYPARRALGGLVSAFYFFGPHPARPLLVFGCHQSAAHIYAGRELPHDSNTATAWAGDNLFRLQYNFSPKHILHGSFLYNRTQDQSLGLDPLDPESTTVDLHQQRSFVSLKDQIWLYDTLIELGVAADSEGWISFRKAQRLTFCW